MDGDTTKKSISLETLVIQNITNVNELKTKLHEIINTGRDYEYDISSCIKSLLKSGDKDIVFLSIQAIAELTKCKDKRETYAVEDVIEPILNLLSNELLAEKLEKQELVKQCCRALGNLCCDCNGSRQIVKDKNGVPTLVSVLEKSIDSSTNKEEIKLFASKVLLNYMIGGKEMAESVLETHLINLIYRILQSELTKVDMNDDIVSTCLLILSVINDNIPEYLFEDKVNMVVLKVLKESASMEVTELCLDHLHMQAENDTVKTLIAQAGGVQLVCSRLELIASRAEGQVEDKGEEVNGDVDAVVKQACDLVVIVLTGDEAMELLYGNGKGEVYTTMVRWLNTPVTSQLSTPVTSPLNTSVTSQPSTSMTSLLVTATLALGNFARKDEYCVAMMREGVFDKLLDLFELYHDNSPLDEATTTKLEHAILSTVRNLLVPEENRKLAASGGGRAGELLARALPGSRAPPAACRLLGAARLLAREESVARLFASHTSFLSAVAGWGRGGHAGAAGEAPRLLAAVARGARGAPGVTQVDGCITCIVNMLVVSHSIMQNEAILALTLLAVQAEKETPEDKQIFITQLIKSEIGKHVSMLIETNCAKMPPEVAENLTTFLELTCKKNEILSDYREAKIAESLKKMVDSRNDFTDTVKNRINGVLGLLNNVVEK